MKDSQTNNNKNKGTVELTSEKIHRLRSSEFHPHILSGDDVLAYLKVNEKMGLSQDNVTEKLKKYGLNELKQEEKKTLISLFIEQFEDFLTRILLGAAFLSFIITYFSEEAVVGFTAYVEPIVIFLILVANSCVSVWQECRAEKSLEALKKLQPELAWVLRDGQYQSAKSSELVIGDLCMIRVGDCVPADMRVIKITSLSLSVEQSQFTGESAPVEKMIEPLDPSMTLCELQSKNNMVFSSTKVVNGTALCVVTATGMRTELGNIQSAVHLASLEEEPSPLEKKLNEFGKLLSKVIGGICVLVWVINYKVRL
jgi:P-type Ca2+ transporter type 2C